MLSFVVGFGLVVAFVVIALVAFTGWTAWQAERLVPPCGRFITIDGVRLHIRDFGEGPAIIMLHGLAAQLQTFTCELTDHLSGRYRLVLVDRPGCGYSEPAVAGASLKIQAAIVAGLMRELDLGPAIVVGHSLGGAVALALALDYPELVAGLALLAPATRPQDDVPVALRSLAIRSDLARWIFGWTLAVPLGAHYRDNTIRLLFGPDPEAPNFAVGAGAVLAARPLTFRNACRDLVEAGSDLARCAARYGEIKAPVGVLYGCGDRILDPEWHGRGLRKLVPDLHLEMTDGGHMLPISDPVRSARFIESIVARAGLDRQAAA